MFACVPRCSNLGWGPGSKTIFCKEEASTLQAQTLDPNLRLANESLRCLGFEHMKEDGKVPPYWCNPWIYLMDSARPDHIGIVTHPEEGKWVIKRVCHELCQLTKEGKNNFCMDHDRSILTNSSSDYSWWGKFPIWDPRLSSPPATWKSASWSISVRLLSAFLCLSTCYLYDVSSQIERWLHHTSIICISTHRPINLGYNDTFLQCYRKPILAPAGGQTLG